MVDQQCRSHLPDQAELQLDSKLQLAAKEEVVEVQAQSTSQTVQRSALVQSSTIHLSATFLQAVIPMASMRSQLEAVVEQEETFFKPTYPLVRTLLFKLALPLVVQGGAATLQEQSLLLTMEQKSPHWVTMRQAFWRNPSVAVVVLAEVPSMSMAL